MNKLKVKIKKGDEVVITAGKSKGSRGKVLQVRRDNSGHVKILVEGANMVKKAIKPNPQTGEQGGIREKEAFLDISNVMLFNPTTDRGERVGFRFLEDGKKVRYFKSSGDLVNADQG